MRFWNDGDAFRAGIQNFGWIFSSIAIEQRQFISFFKPHHMKRVVCDSLGQRKGVSRNNSSGAIKPGVRFRFCR
jgi:hypothetical protein